MKTLISWLLSFKNDLKNDRKKNKSLDNQLTVKALCFKLVGATGFEPATPWSQTKCATNCATPLTFMSSIENGGEAGIRTLGTVTRTSV
jgi:hypothetical protein